MSSAANRTLEILRDLSLEIPNLKHCTAVMRELDEASEEGLDLVLSYAQDHFGGWFQPWEGVFARILIDGGPCTVKVPTSMYVGHHYPVGGNKAGQDSITFSKHGFMGFLQHRYPYRSISARHGGTPSSHNGYLYVPPDHPWYLQDEETISRDVQWIPTWSGDRPEALEWAIGFHTVRSFGAGPEQTLDGSFRILESWMAAASKVLKS